MSERKAAGISEEKAKRIAVAATVAGVLLVLFLVVILIVQFVQIGVRNAEKKKLQQSIDRYQQLIDSDGKNLDYYLTEEGLYDLVIGWGYTRKK